MAIISENAKAFLESITPKQNYMTHYYCLIMAGRSIDDSTKIYRVGVGTSKQADRDYLFLLAQSVQHNWYFEKWSLEVADFVQNVTRSLAPVDSDDPIGGALIQGVTARDLVRAIKQGHDIPRDENQIHNVHYLRTFLSLNYRSLANRQGEAPHLPSK